MAAGLCGVTSPAARLRQPGRRRTNHPRTQRPYRRLARQPVSIDGCAMIAPARRAVNEKITAACPQAPALVKWSWRRSGAVGVMASPGPLLRAAGRGACASSLHTIQIGSSVDMAPGLRELIALSLLAGLGCGLALAHGDLFFVVVFGGAIAMAIIEAIRHLR
jgi:hypothetical protein